MEPKYVDATGTLQNNRRSSVTYAGLPPWVNYSVIISVISLVFWGGVQANRLDTISRQLDTVQNQLTVVQSNDPRADVAVLKEHMRLNDQAVSDMRDSILRRLDRMESNFENRKK